LAARTTAQTREDFAAGNWHTRRYSDFDSQCHGGYPSILVFVFHRYDDNGGFIIPE
jgi:hypothetical protein